MNEIVHSSAKVFISSSNTANWVSTSSNTQLLVPISPFILQNKDPSHFVIGLESASIPLSIYAVNTTNRVLRLNAYTFNIAQGNYAIAVLISYLNTYNDGIFDNNTLQYFVFSYDSVNNRITIVSTDPANVTSIIIGSTTTCQTILGVASGTFAGLTYKALGQVNLTFTSGILIALNNIQTSNRDNKSLGSGSTILARIPINCPLFRVLSFYNPQPFYTTIANRVISNLNISLLNDDYTPLVLQGNPNFFLTLRVDYAEKLSPTIQKSDIQIARDIKGLRPSDAPQLTRKDLTSRVPSAL